MTVSINKVLETIHKYNETLVTKSSDFGLEFSPVSYKQLSASTIKGIVLSPFISLGLFPFMRENDLNFIISVLGSSAFTWRLPLSDYDYEVIKSLATNNYKTLKLGKKWLYSKTGAFRFFFQGLGIKEINAEMFLLPSGSETYIWNGSTISLNDFLQLISHHTTNWLCASANIKQPLGSFIIDQDLHLTKKDINYLQREGVNTIFSFSMNTIKLSTLKPLQLNYIVLPFIPVVNLALKKLSQLLELELEIKVLAFSRSDHEFINYSKLKKLK